MNWRHFRFNVIEWTVLPLGILFLKLIVATYRIDAETRARVEKMLESERLFVVTLHGMSLSLLAFNGIACALGRQLVVMTSPSRDGLLMDKIVRRFNIVSVKGSSRSKSAQGAKGMIEAVRDEKLVALLTPDGPRGPIFVPKKGFIRMVPASESRLRIVAVGTRRAIVFPAWDRLFLPMPFSRLSFVDRDFEYEDPQTPEAEEALLRRMRDALVSAAQEVGCPITRGFVS